MLSPVRIGLAKMWVFPEGLFVGASGKSKFYGSIPPEGYPLESAATFAADLRLYILPQISCKIAAHSNG